MRFARNLLVGLVALGSAACTSTDVGPTNATVPPLAFVRYISAVPDTLNTSVRWVDDVQFTPQTFLNVGYRQEGLGGFQGLRAGDRHLRVFLFQQVGNDFPAAVNTTVMVDTTFNFVAGRYYTLVHAGFARAGSNPADRLLIIEDDPPASPAAGVLLRVYNFAYTTPAWEIRFGTTASPVDTLVPGSPGPPVVPPVTQVRDTTAGWTWPAAAAGAVIHGSSGATAETVSMPYSPLAVGRFAARFFDPGTLTARGVRVTVPDGLAETTDFEAVGGSNVAGSVMTMWVFDRKTAGSPNATGRDNSRPSVLFTVDRKPARVLAP